MSQPDEGPAFPSTKNPMKEGLSIRDWFAGMALQGQASFEGMEGCNKEQWVGMAYELADAMIERRKLP